MSIWTVLEFAFVFVAGFHAALFTWLVVRFVYGFVWSMVAYFAVVSAVLFALLRISA